MPALKYFGEGSAKGNTLCKNALPILDWVHPDALRYYTDTFGESNFSGERAHKERNYRVAEAVRMIRNAGVNVVPYTLPRLQNEIRVSALPEIPVFYTAKDIKKIDRAEMNKTMYSRMVGAIFYDKNCYAVYNTRKSAMKWKGICVLPHFDGDISRLIRFKQAIETTHRQCEVLCFPHQTRYVKQYLGELCEIKNIKLDVIENEMLENEYF